LEFNVPFQHKYGYIRDEPNTTKAHVHQSKHMYYNTQNKHKKN